MSSFHHHSNTGGFPAFSHNGNASSSQSGLRVPVITIQSDRREAAVTAGSSPLSSRRDPVLGLITASSVEAPFELDHNDPLLQSGTLDNQNTEARVEAEQESSEGSVDETARDSSARAPVADHPGISMSSSESSDDCIHIDRSSSFHHDGDTDSSDDEAFIQRHSKMRGIANHSATVPSVASREGNLERVPNAAGDTSLASLGNKSTSVANIGSGTTSGGKRTVMQSAPDLVDSSREKMETSRPVGDAQSRNETRLRNRIESNICTAEEKMLFTKIENSIVTAEMALRAPGANVITVWRATADMENEIILHREVAPQPRKRRRVSRKVHSELRMFDVVDWGSRVVTRKKLPRFVGADPAVELTNASFRTEIIASILADDPLPRRRLTGGLRPIENDPYSVSLALRGHPDVLNQILEATTAYIRSFQVVRSRSLERNNTNDASLDVGDLHDAWGNKLSIRYDRGDSGETGTHRPTQSGQSSLQHFRAKLYDAARLEYKDRINLNTVFKLMWVAHKKLYGKQCDSRCKCPSALPALTKDVVRSHMDAKMKKDKSWSNPHGLRPDDVYVGFVNRFAPRFYGLIEEEFPDEDPGQCLGRLVLMFGKHREERRFGLRCQKGCACGEGWERVFKRGHLRPDDEHMASTRGKSTNSTPITGRCGLASIPRVSKKPASEETKLNGTAVDKTVIPRKRKLQDHTVVAPLVGIPEQRAWYEIQYNAGQTLGFHCTKKQEGEGTVCIVDSISSQGRKVDDRLQNGTVIAGAYVGDNTELHNVDCHTTLKALFERAKKNSSTLRLRFINTYVKQGTLNELQSKRNWSAAGTWQGSKSGWAGGAPSIRTQERKAVAPVDRRVDRDSFGAAGPRLVNGPAIPSPSMEKTCGVPKEENLIWKSSMVMARHRDQSRPAPILKTNAHLSRNKAKPANVGFVRSLINLALSSSTKKSVHFPKEYTQRRFFKRGDLAYRLAVLAFEDPGHEGTREKTVTMLHERPSDHESTILPTRDELFHAIRQGTFAEVLDLLRRGAPFEEPDEAGSYAIDVAKSIEAGDETTPATDPKLKMTLLRIHLNARYTIDSARFLKGWIQLDIQFKGLRNFRLTRLGKEHASANQLQCRVTWYTPGEEDVLLTELPTVDMIPDMVDWNAHPAQHVTFNASLDGARARCLVVTLQKGSTTHLVGPIILGRLEIPLSRLGEESQFHSFREDDLEESFSSTEYLQSATILVNSRKGHASNTYRNRKRREAGKKLSETIRWIQRLNEELVVNHSVPAPSVTGQIAPAQCKYTSLLHAAVYLSDFEGVKSLLRLGADPFALSEVGSAQKLASKMAERRAIGPRFRDGGQHDEYPTVSHDAKQNEDSSVAILRILTEASNEQRFELDSANATTSTGDRVNHDDNGSIIHSESLPDENAIEEAYKPLQPNPTFEELMQSLSEGKSDHDEGGAAPLTEKSTPDVSFEPSPHPLHGEKQALGAYSRFWVMAAGDKRCTFFNKPVGCRFGLACKNVHIRQVVGEPLNDPNLTRGRTVEDFNPAFVHHLEATGSNGEVYFTAAYVDEWEKVTTLAESGNIIMQSGGVSWYKNRDDAETALYGVLVYWNIKEKTKERSTRSSVRSDVATARSNLDDGSYFDRLRKANLANIFTQVFREQILTEYWEVKHSDSGDGYFTATLRLPFSVGGENVFRSWEIGGGVVRQDHRGYYRDIRSAKASAFYYLLVKAMEEGRISRDMWSTKAGAPLKMY